MICTWLEKVEVLKHHIGKGAYREVDGSLPTKGFPSNVEELGRCV